ncbi:MAG: neutral/alkaline non-lysosomal ceramidase N-terminal domain-containing protein, partial [Clostridia bacterium]|nr:neutral/alkaline non-lysosomal ceramidase N-terminal domain-containing protein [Clostridia bacterium]
MSEKRLLKVGYHRELLPVPQGVGLGGFGNTDARLSDKVLDDLFLTCVAISDEEETLLLYSVDLLGVSEKNHRIVSEWVEENLSIPKKNVFITATHNHSAPNVRDGAKSVEAFLPTFYEGMQNAAKGAVETMKTSEMYVGSIDMHQMNYVRRYYRADGTFSGVAYVAPSKAPIAMHETRVDNTMQVIRFRRAGAKDVVMVNFPCHVTTTSGLKRTDVSADWVGGFRDAAEEKLDVLFAFYQGAAGNVVPNSSLKGE